MSKRNQTISSGRIGPTIGRSDYNNGCALQVCLAVLLKEIGSYVKEVRFEGRVGWHVRAITMNALAEIFYMASGYGDAATEYDCANSRDVERAGIAITTFIRQSVSTYKL